MVMPPLTTVSITCNRKPTSKYWPDWIRADLTHYISWFTVREMANTMTVQTVKLRAMDSCGYE